MPHTAEWDEGEEMQVISCKRNREYWDWRTMGIPSGTKDDVTITRCFHKWVTYPNGESRELNHSCQLDIGHPGLHFCYMGHPEDHPKDVSQEDIQRIGATGSNVIDYGRMDQLNISKSGASSSFISPPYFSMPMEFTTMTAERWGHGSSKHKEEGPVYSEQNWLKAYHAKDYAFFRDRSGHALEHGWNEMRGVEDPDPGGNIGAIGWFWSVMAFIKVNDPEFYKVIQGVKRP